MGQGKIFLRDLPVVKLAREFSMSLIGSCDHHQTRSFSIESMNNSWAVFPSDARKLITMAQQRVDESVLGCSSWGRMYDHSSLFGDHDDLIILMDQIQFVVFRQRNK